MGNEHSVLDDSTPSVKLEERSLSAVAKLIKDGKATKIVVMTGAGLSTAAGIPDFRSPGTGLYANLARLNLPTAESVFDIAYFRQNPNPFYVLAKELYPGNYKPTLSHAFIALLARKGLLCKLFTQNIDCLEREAGVPGDLIIEAHGSFATQRCIDCKTEFPDDVMKKHVLSGEVPHCVNEESCYGLVKPDIVFFGESLPSAFFHSLPVLEEADLALVLGTSLTVHPFASLPERLDDSCPRVLFNMERVGSLGTRPDDVLALGDCDANVCTLADELGWLDELYKLWEDTVGEAETERQLKGIRDRKKEMLKEMDELTKRIGANLTINDADANDETDHSAGEDATGTTGGVGSSTEAGEVASSGSESGPRDETAKASSEAQDDSAATKLTEPEAGTDHQTAGEGIQKNDTETSPPKAEASDKEAPAPESQTTEDTASKDSKEAVNKSAL